MYLKPASSISLTNSLASALDLHANASNPNVTISGESLFEFNNLSTSYNQLRKIRKKTQYIKKDR